MKTLRSLFTAALILALASMAAPARAADESPFKFEFHGFVVGSVYLQNQTFASGQGSGLLVAAPRPSLELPQPGVVTSKSDTFFGADVRQSRPIFVITGPQVFGGATPKGYFEADFFGVNNVSALGYEMPNLRLRQAYAELSWNNGNTKFDAGQHSAQLLVTQIPTTLAHITNPVTYGAGLVGWRTVGLRFFQTFPLDTWKLEIGLEVSEPKWSDIAGPAGPVFPGNQPDQISLAWASSMPQFVGRLKLDGKLSDAASLTVYAAGSVEKVNLKGFGNSVNPNGVTLQDGTVKTGLTSWVGEGGLRFQYAFTPDNVLNVNGQVYTGRGTGPLAGTMIQFGDIGDFGFYVEAGISIIKPLSVWGIFGSSAADKDDLQNWLNTAGTPRTVANTTLKSDNQMYGGMLRYMDGGYAIGAEYYHYETKYLLGTLAAPGGTTSTSAYQFLVSAGYFF